MTHAQGPLPQLHYYPPPARVLSQEEINGALNRLTRKTVFHAFIEHPKGAIVEYPETGRHIHEAVAHRIPFTESALKQLANPLQKWSAEPKGNIQYSLGGKHGGYKTKSALGLPHDLTQVDCCVISISCRSLKICDASEQKSTQHSYFSGDWRSYHLPHFESPTDSEEISHSAEREYFEKTLAFYCAISCVGCAFSDNSWILRPRAAGHLEDPGSSLHPEVSTGTDPGLSVLDDGNIFDDLGNNQCSGQIILDRDYMGRTVIRCEHASLENRAHLVLRNLNGFNLDYLSALLSRNTESIARHERAALQGGYGPLAPCTFTASSSQKKQYCEHWRRIGGELVRGELHRSIECPAHFSFYYAESAEDRKRFPFFLLICQNPHSRLADATPRRLLLDHGFMSSLRTVLCWTDNQDPFLSHLHPSLGNHSHVNRIILELRQEIFPHGTGLESLVAMQVDHEQLPVAQRYIRFAGVVDLLGLGGDTMKMVVCMTSDMSSCLLLAKRLTIDTSFQRLHGLDEFEIEFWDNLSQKSIVAARVFTSSQSAEAHYNIFSKVFGVAEADTGTKLRLRYMHGQGLELVTADGHRGQALGFGKLLSFVARGNKNLCPSIPGKTWEDLTEWQQVYHVYRYCEVHYKRNILKLRGKVSKEVEYAMLSLCSAHAINNYDEVIATIKYGGPIAAGWPEEKQTFALAAIYRPASFIPLEIWSAGPSTTNGNEQSHRNIYRDVVQLTALAGAMRGYEYDRRAMEARKLAKSNGIFSRDIVSTQEYRQTRSILRAESAKKKRIDDADQKVEEFNKKIAVTDAAILKADVAIQRASAMGKDVTKQTGKRAKLHERNSKMYAEARVAMKSGSGSVRARKPRQAKAPNTAESFTHLQTEPSTSGAPPLSGEEVDVDSPNGFTLGATEGAVVSAPNDWQQFANFMSNGTSSFLPTYRGLQVDQELTLTNYQYTPSVSSDIHMGHPIQIETQTVMQSNEHDNTFAATSQYFRIRWFAAELESICDDANAARVHGFQ